MRGRPGDERSRRTRGELIRKKSEGGKVGLVYIAEVRFQLEHPSKPDRDVLRG